MSKNILKILILILVFNQIILAESNVPNTIISDNPNKEVTTLKLEKKNEINYLDIKVLKIKTKEIIKSYKVDKNTLVVELPDIIDNESDFYVTDSIRDLKYKKLKKITSEYKVIKELDNKSLKVIGKNFNKNLYLINFNKENKSLLTVYKYNGKNITQNEKKKILEIVVNDYYNSYEKVTLTKGKVENGIQITGGEIVQLPLGTKEVKIYSSNKELLKIIPINSGNGNIGLGKDNSGIILKNSNSYLKLGIGFFNRLLELNLKNWSFDSKDFEFIIEAENKKEKLVHKVIIFPPKQKLKILNNETDFNFGSIDMNKVRQGFTLTKEIRVQVPDNIGNVTAELVDNGNLVMKHEKENTNITAKLSLRKEEPKKKKVNNREKVWTFEVDGEIPEEELVGKPFGTYSGETQAIINIE